MTNTKTTKRALLASVMALFLCFAMLLGTTYAWFTDSVTSANNIIKTGTLKIDLVHNTKTGDVSLKDPNNADYKIFNYENWEPGFTRVETLTIVNKGSLSLKYEMTLSTVNEVNNGEYRLADVIDVYVCEGASTAHSAANLTGTAWTKLGTLADVMDDSKKVVEGNLLAEGKTERTFTIALHMQESAGNEYQGLSLGDLAVTLLATQYTYEEDSFGKNYDENAALGTYIELEAGADLLAAMASAEEGMPLSIKLNGDVEWPTDGHNGVNDVTKASSVVIDGQDMYKVTAVGAGVTALGDNDAPMTLKNLTVVDNSVSYKEDSWEFGYLEITGVICKNVVFTDPIMVEGQGASFENCTFTGYTDKGVDDDGQNYSMTMYGVWAISGTQNYRNCTFVGTRGMKVCDSNVSNSYAAANVNVTVDGCTFNNLTEKPGVAIDYSGDTDITFAVTIKNSTFINCQAGDQGLYIYETDNVVPTVENNTVLNNVSAVVEIDTKEELFDFAKAVNDGDTNMIKAYVQLTDDIDLENEAWTAIGDCESRKYFQGTFDGQGHTISNLNVDYSTDDSEHATAGLFGWVDAGKATVKNLNIDGATVKGSHWVGVIAGYFTGKIENCSVNNATVIGYNLTDDANGDKIGGIVGCLNEHSYLNNNSITNSTISGNRDIGGIAGSVAASTYEMNNNTVSNVKITYTTAKSYASAGEIVSGRTGYVANATNVATNVTIACVASASTADELKTALSSGATEIQINGIITLTQGLNASNVTLVGVDDNAGINFAGHNLGGSGTITYKNLDLTTVSLPNTPQNGERYGWYGGIDYNGHSVANYEDCTITGVFTTYSSEVNATRCTFNSYVQDNEEFYNIFMYCSGTVNATECTFMYRDRAIKIYSEGANTFTLNINGGQFVATDDYSVNKPLINVDSTYFANATINVNGVTIDSKLATAALYNTASKTTVTVDGVTQ